MESILTSIKKKLGITEEYAHFDEQIIMDINSVLMILGQIGVGKEDFFISTDMQTWDEFLNNSKQLEAAKTYVYLRVKLMFDPPQNASIYEAYKKQADELEWRLNVKVETGVN